MASMRIYKGRIGRPFQGFDFSSYCIENKNIEEKLSEFEERVDRYQKGDARVLAFGSALLVGGFCLGSLDLSLGEALATVAGAYGISYGVVRQLQSRKIWQWKDADLKNALYDVEYIFSTGIKGPQDATAKVNNTFNPTKWLEYLVGDPFDPEAMIRVFPSEGQFDFFRGEGRNKVGGKIPYGEKILLPEEFDTILSGEVVDFFNGLTPLVQFSGSSH